MQQAQAAPQAAPPAAPPAAPQQAQAAPAKVKATTEIMGGLGNQLFQIFSLLAYSFQHHIPFYFSQEPIHHGERKTTYWSTLFLQALQPFVKDHRGQQTSLIYQERNFHYESIPAPLPQYNIKLFGYFQSYKYFQEQEELIYRFIKLRETQTALREKTQQPPYGYDYANTVALHFRVGDYKNLQNHHPLMTLEYYTEALKQLGASHNVLYFCEEDDQAYIQEKMLTPLQQNPLFQNKFTFQCIDHNLSDWEQLIVMSLCRHHIIANSTFSWWGAYMGGNRQLRKPPQPPHLGQADASTVSKNHNQPLPETGVWGLAELAVSPQVYYPTTWFGPAMGNKNLSDLFPKHWHRISI